MAYQEHSQQQGDASQDPVSLPRDGKLPTVPDTRRDVYSRITEQILADLEKGVRPWAKPWSAAHVAGPITRPLRFNGTPYRGINVLMLWMSAASQGFSPPIWLTFRQVKELGGHVRQGAKATLVVYADHFEKKETTRDGEENTRDIWFMRGYQVFNVDQTEKLPKHYYATTGSKLDPAKRVEHAEAFFRNTHARLTHGGDSAHYSVTEDSIQMPHFETFRDPESYYATLGHETVHWTRHPSRLNRDFGRKTFGDEGYAREELVAEIGSAFLCSDLGLEPVIREDHAAYLASWIRVLKSDKRFIVQAAAFAQKAVDFLHELQPESAPVPEEHSEGRPPLVVVSGGLAPKVEPAAPPAGPPAETPEPEPSSPTPALESHLAVTVNPRRFLERFRAASLFAARRSQLPILETVQLHCENGKAVLRAGTFDAFCSLSLPLLKAVSPGAVQLSRDQVLKALKEAKCGSVTLSEEPSDDPPNLDPKAPTRRLLVRTERSEVRLSTLSPESFPVPAPESPLSSVTLPAFRLTELLERTLFACDPSSTRFALGGVCIEFADGQLIATGTDGRRLAIASATAAGISLEAPKTTIVGGEERPLAPVLSETAAKGLIEVLKLLEPNQKLSLGFTPGGRFQVEGEGLFIASRLPEGRFPPWRDVLPPEGSASATLRARDLERELRSLSRFVTPEDRGVTLVLHGARLTLSVKNATASTSASLLVEDLPPGSEETATAVIDPDYLLPYLAVHQGRLTLRFPPSHEWPLLFESENYRFLLMPLKRDDATAPAKESSRVT